VTEKMPMYLVKPNADLVPMKPSAPATEDELQALIARHPELIGDSDGALLLIEREVGIPGTADAAPRWSIDHLYVTRQAVPVLVEVKRAVDTRLRREVVGQLLDYAANGVAYWPAGSIGARFEAVVEARGDDPGSLLADFIGEQERVADFWNQVDANLRAGKVKLVIVADEIPTELARIVEFLNDQMRADVRAIELTYFDGPDGSRMLAPRIIGETERSRVQKSGVRPKLEAISMEDWLTRHIEPHGVPTLRGGQALIDVVRDLVDEVAVASTQGSIYARITGKEGRSSYPFFLTRGGKAQIGFGWLGGSPALADEGERKRFYDRFNASVGPLSRTNLKGFPGFPPERLNDAERLRAFREVARDFVAACRA